MNSIYLLPRLTIFGQSIIPILDAMCQWGTNYLNGLDVQPPYCKG
ncbi:winged helix-turn-helix transcriptional regulator [Ruminococcus sp. 5_1_39BFAA]